MRVKRLLIVTALTIALLPAAPAAAGSYPATGGEAGMTAKKKQQQQKAKAKRKRCRKGYVLKTVKVKRKGKTVRVKRCRKKRKPVAKQKVAAPSPAPPAPTPAPAPTPPLFDPPGARLEGMEAARPFLERYLHDSRFTDCPAGWPSCAVEERYGHFASGAFFYCRLTPTSGADISFSSSYDVQDAVVEADGAWSFDEVVPNGQSTSFYTWHVAVDGSVTGVYKIPGRPPEQIGPFQYVAGARDCSV